MRQLHDPGNVELKRVLGELLTGDIDISVREVARRHSLAHASAFTRNTTRLKLIEDAIEAQRELRVNRESSVPVLPQGERLDQARRRVKELEEDVRRLVSAHQLCVRAVAACGGMAALERYWSLYEDIAETLRRHEAVPSGSVVRLEKR